MSTGVVEDVLGAAAVQLYVRVVVPRGWGIPPTTRPTTRWVPVPTDATGPVRIVRGRSRPSERFDPAELSVSMYADLPTSVVPVHRIGTGVACYVELTRPARTYFYGDPDAPAAEAARVRFAGILTAAQLDAARQPRPVLTLTGTGRMARMGRFRVGDTPWPAEVSGARARRILTAALAADPLLYGDPASVPDGTRTVRARDVDRQPPAALFDDLADSVGGELVELRAGAVTWQGPEHRRVPGPALTLNAGDVLQRPVWNQGLSGLVNDVTVTYGSADPQPEVRTSDPARVSNDGPYEVRLTTELSNVLDAGERAVEIVGRGSAPAWLLDEVSVELVRSLGKVKAASLLQLDVSTLLALEGLPDSAPSTAGRYFLEGWTETITRHGWRLDLAVSDQHLTGPATRYVDVPTAVTYADVPDYLSYLGATAWDV